MGERTHTAAGGTTEKCPDRPNGPGPDGHGFESVEQPDDMDAFYVERCLWCGKVFTRHDTEQEHLERTPTPDDGQQKHSTDMGGLF